MIKHVKVGHVMKPHVDYVDLKWHKKCKNRLLLHKIGMPAEFTDEKQK